ncbi:hypothetical protein D3C71_1396050 [compost metagenome]
MSRSCCSLRRRARNSASANCSALWLASASTNTCSIFGNVSRASSPQTLASVGTSRQPRGWQPALRSWASSSSRHRWAASASCGRNTTPAAKLGPMRMPASSASWRRNTVGLRSSRPQPSPVSPSAATPPRWVMRDSAAMAVSTNRRDGWSSSCATMPKPQASRSSCGS